MSELDMSIEAVEKRKQQEWFDKMDAAGKAREERRPKWAAPEPVQPDIEALTFEDGWIRWACSTKCEQHGGCWKPRGEVHIHIEDIPDGSSGLDVGAILRAQQATIAEQGVVERVLDDRITHLEEQNHDQEVTITELRDILRTKVAGFLCPVHGSASCPEEYMLDSEGKPWASNRWSEDMRCGQRFSLAALGEGE